MVTNTDIEHGDLHGKDVAITGGARGIGLATAIAFARRGALAAIGDLDAAGARLAATGIGGTRQGLSDSLRGELRGSGIAISIVMPAIIATEMADGLGSARGVRPVEPTVVGEAIVRAVRRGRGADVYVPGYAGAINTAMSVLPRTLRDAIHHLIRADTVLTDVDQSARARYNTRIGTGDKPRGIPNSTVQQP